MQANHNLRARLRSGWEWLVRVQSDDEEQRRIGRLFNILMLISFGIVTALAAVFVALASLGHIGATESLIATGFPVTFMPLSIICLVASRRGHVRSVIQIYTWMNMSAIGVAVWLFDGLYSAAWILFSWTISIAGILLAPVYALWLSVGVLGYYGVLMVFSFSGLYEPMFSFGVEGLKLASISFILIMLASTVGLLTYLSMRSLRQALDGLRAENAERRRAEKEIRKLNEELLRQEKLATLGQVAGVIGNELRNPLGVISNALYFLKTVLTDADATTKEYLAMIGDETNRAADIVADLLDSVRTKSPNLQPVAPSLLVEESLSKCRLPNSIVLRQRVGDSLPPVFVDPLQIEQVLANLIRNAVDAMPKGGELHIDAEIMRSNIQGRILRLRVSDTGTGIAPENMGNLFKPLFTTKARGLGLGLTVVKNLTENNGGRVEVKSKPGDGTAFTLELPLVS